MDDSTYYTEEALLIEEMMKSGLTKKQAYALAYYAYEHGHSAGYEEVINILKNFEYEMRPE